MNVAGSSRAPAVSCLLSHRKFLEVGEREGRGLGGNHSFLDGSSSYVGCDTGPVEHKANICGPSSGQLHGIPGIFCGKASLTPVGLLRVVAQSCL